MAVISLYNQDQLVDDDFVAAFVARGPVLNMLLDGLRHITAGGETEHRVLIGMRGMGKTSMLRRVAISIGEDNRLRDAFLPLRFREEQYNVLSLATFWRNCGEALAEWCERNGHEDLARDIDRAIETPAWREADTALSGLLGFCEGLGRRPCLLIDNLDLILGNMKNEGWAFRNALQREDGPVVIGAATQPLRQAGDRKAAFYEFFHPIDLEPLDKAELMHCMRTLADGRGAAGQPVRDVLARSPERIQTLYTLTGGNPRVLALIYRLMEQAETDKVFDDLQALLDGVTAFYKARVEEIQTAQQRAIVDAIALHWDPITSGTLSETTGIPVTTISSQLNRLRKTGFIQQVEMSGSYAGYQLAERFLNIWYLMRHGTRRTKQRLRWLTLILARLYSDEELGRLSDRAEVSGWRQEFRLSLREAREEISAAKFAPEGLGLLAIKESMDCTIIAPRTSSAGILSVAATNRVDDHTSVAWTFERSEDGLLSQTETVDFLEGVEAPALSEDDAREGLSKGYALGDLGRHDEALEAFDAVVAQFGESKLPALQKQVAGLWMGGGRVLGGFGRQDEALEAFDAVMARFGESELPTLQERVARALTSKGYALGRLGRFSEAFEAFGAVVARFGESELPALQEQVARTWIGRGYALGDLGRHDEALEAFDAVVTRFGESKLPALQERVARALAGKGYALGRLGRFSEALEAFDAVVARFGESELPALQKQVARALTGKGYALGDLGRQDEALEAFDAVMARFGESELPTLQERVARALAGKGYALGRLGRFSEALEAFDAVVARFGESEFPDLQERVARALANKGNALGRLGRSEEALEAFDAVVARFGESELPALQERVARALANKGNALDELGRHDEALEAFDAVVTRFGESELPALQERVARALTSRGSALGRLDRFDEALEAFDAVLMRFGESELPALQEHVARTWIGSGIAFANLGRLSEALDAFDAVIVRFGESDLSALQEGVAWALAGKSTTLADLGRHGEALDSFDAVVARFGESDLPVVQERVARALASKGDTLRRLGRHREALDAFDAVVVRFGASDLPTMQERVARALASKGYALGDLGRHDEALEVFDAVVTRFGESDLPALQERVARAWVNKGIALELLGRHEEALEAFDAVVARFGASDLPALQERVARALAGRGSALGQLGHSEEALEAFDAVLARFGKNASKDIQPLLVRCLSDKGRMLIDLLGRYQDAEFCLRESLNIQYDLQNCSNLVWSLIAQSRAGEAQTVRNRLNGVSPEGLDLIDAGIELVRDNLGNALARLHAALDRNDIRDGASAHFEDIIWLLRIGVDRGHGERLIEWFVESHNDDRYTPVYGALVAYVRGERFLRDLNPEVRGVAERLYEQMAAPRKRSPKVGAERRRSGKAADR